MVNTMSDDKMVGIAGGFISSQDLRAARICRELQNWISSIEGVSSEPMVALTITDGMTSIEIGQTCVWCSESDSDDDLTFELCQKVFQDEILELTHYARIGEGDERR